MRHLPRGWALICVMHLCIIGMLGRAHAQTGDELVRKVEAAYGALKSYSHTMRATGQVVIEGSSRTGELTSELRYKAPNKLYMSINSPAVGTVTAVTDGKREIIYFGRRNAVLRLPSPPSLKQFLEGLKKFQIAAVLDPLYFLVGEPASKLATGFVVKGQDTVNGAACDMVMGTIKRNTVQTARSGRITLWIDRKTLLVRKTMLELQGVPLRTSSRKDPKSPPVIQVSLANETLAEAVQKMQINPPLKDSDFVPVIPANAKPVGAPPPSR